MTMSGQKIMNLPEPEDSELTPKMSDVEEREEDTKTEAVKNVAKVIAKASAKFVIAGAISSILPDPETKIQKVKVLVGSYVIADMVAKNAGSHIEEKIDGWKKNIQEVRAEIKKIEGKIMTDKAETPNP